MTYPPQPGQPGWNPAGMNQGGWNQPGPPPYGPPPGQYGMYPAGPPPQKKTGLIVGISIAVVLVLFGVFALLAWVTPGFLLSDDEDEAGEGGGGSGGLDDSALAERIIQGFNDQDQQALRQLACQDADPQVDEVIGLAGEVDQAELDTVISGKDSSNAIGRVSAGGREMQVTASLTRTGEGWCWQSTTMSAGDTPAEPETDTDDDTYDDDVDVDSGSARSLAQAFASAVNSGDRDSAVRLACSGDEESVGNNADSIIEQNVPLTVDSYDGDLVHYQGEAGKDGHRAIKPSKDSASSEPCVTSVLMVFPE